MALSVVLVNYARSHGETLLSLTVATSTSRCRGDVKLVFHDSVNLNFND